MTLLAFTGIRVVMLAPYGQDLLKQQEQMTDWAVQCWTHYSVQYILSVQLCYNMTPQLLTFCLLTILQYAWTSSAYSYQAHHSVACLGQVFAAPVTNLPTMYL